MGIVGIERNSIVGLHDTRIPKVVVTRWNSYVAMRLFHDDAQDYPAIDAGLIRDLVDRDADVVYFVLGVLMHVAHDL